MAQAKLGTGTAVRETGGALLIKLADVSSKVARKHPDGVWFPKSQIDDESEVYRQGQTGEVIVSEWIAEQKGLA